MNIEDRALHSAVRQYRLGMDGGGSATLVGLIDQFAKACQDPATLPEEVERAMPVLQAVLSAQQTGDFLRVADLLQYELLPLLHKN